MDYAKCVRAVCERQHYPITKLEYDCGFSQGTIHRWNRTIPQIDKFEKVADVLGCSIDELCGRMYYVEQAEKRTDAALENMLRFQQELNATRSPDDLSDDERRIVRVFRSLSDPDKVQFLFQILKFNDSKEK